MFFACPRSSRGLATGQRKVQGFRQAQQQRSWWNALCQFDKGHPQTVSVQRFAGQNETEFSSFFQCTAVTFVKLEEQLLVEEKIYGFWYESNSPFLKWIRLGALPCFAFCALSFPGGRQPPRDFRRATIVSSKVLTSSRRQTLVLDRSGSRTIKASEAFYVF